MTVTVTARSLAVSAASESVPDLPRGGRKGVVSRSFRRLTYDSRDTMVISRTACAPRPRAPGVRDGRVRPAPDGRAGLFPGRFRKEHHQLLLRHMKCGHYFKTRLA
jgi:hypothetical protein